MQQGAEVATLRGQGLVQARLGQRALMTEDLLGVVSNRVCIWLLAVVKRGFLEDKLEYFVLPSHHLMPGGHWRRHDD